MCKSDHGPPPPMPPSNSEDAKVNTGQVGYNNKLEQHNTLIITHLGQMNLYLGLFVVIIGLVVIFGLLRYLNLCLSKRIDRGAEAMVMRRRTAEDGGAN